MTIVKEIALGLIILFVLSAGCVDEKAPDQEITAPVQDNDAPEITLQETVVPATTTAKFSLTSGVFQDGGTIPSRYTCDDADIPPPLWWGKAPEGTRSFALIVDDPDAPGGIFTHWVLFDLPPDNTCLPEGVSIPDIGGIQGKNDFDKIGYKGPCPPKLHTYRFILYALDYKIGLKEGASRQEVLKAMEGHIIEKAELDGKYGE